MPSRRAPGIRISVIAYIVALLVAVLVVRAVGPWHPLAELALGALVATVVVFAFSVAANNSSIYDPYWSVQPVAIAVYYVWATWGRVDPRLILATVLLCLYSLRLTSNFYRDWPGLSKEDFRYRAFRERFGRAYWPVSFVGIHLFPTIMVYLGCLPLYGIVASDTNRLHWLDIVAEMIMFVAVFGAFVADEQLRRWRKDPASRGAVIEIGLWGRCRHPNYLGEISTWWGLWLLAMAAGVRFWWTVAGAVAITVMFVFVSVPMMEKRLLATRPGYAEYRARTPMLLPRLRGAGAGEAGGQGAGVDATSPLGDDDDA